MKPKTFSAIGGWQSFLFCVGMYIVALFFSIFVCSSIFYAINTKSAAVTKTEVKAPPATSGKKEFASVGH